MIIAYILLLIAVVMDLRSMRISNRLILIGLAFSLVRRFFCEGLYGFFTGIFLISLPVIFLYLLFLVGALGAGDIKLFSLVGGFVNFKELMWCMVAAFLFAAFFSFVKMLYLGTIFTSMKRVCRYMAGLLQGHLYVYKPASQRDSQIHFSIAILFGFISTDLFYIS